MAVFDQKYECIIDIGHISINSLIICIFMHNRLVLQIQTEPHNRLLNKQNINNIFIIDR